MKKIISLAILATLLLLPFTSEAQRGKDNKQNDSKAFYSPFDSEYKLITYNLKEALAESKKQKAAGKGYSYDCVMLQEFAEQYYPGFNFEWEKLTAAYYFGFKGKANLNEMAEGQMFVSWQSFSDGLEWCFFNTDLTRSKGANPFSVIENARAKEKIEKYLAKTGIKPNANCDVFLYQYRTFCTDQKTENVPFKNIAFSKERYGVLVNNKLYWFSLLGDFVEA